MTKHGIVCKLDGSIKTEGDCYFNNCSNEQFFECFPNETSGYKTAKPIKTYDPPNKNP